MAWVNIEDVVAQNPPSQKEVQQVLDYLSRKAKARFLADENFPEPAVTLLRAMGGKVQTSDAAGLKRHPDENYAAYARRNGLVLATCDRDFLDERRFPLIHCPAIFVFDFGFGSRQEMKQNFRCLVGVFRAPQFYDKWCKVDAKRDCWTEILRHLDGSTSRNRRRLWHGKLQEWVNEG
jgi:predicted nuclease of predicted toxin-antitoxin system